MGYIGNELSRPALESHCICLDDLDDEANPLWRSLSNSGVKPTAYPVSPSETTLVRTPSHCDNRNCCDRYEKRSSYERS